MTNDEYTDLLNDLLAASKAVLFKEIDDALRQVSGRSLIDTAAVTDMLLDIRRKAEGL